MILKISDGHDKGLDAVVTLNSDAPGKDDSVSGLYTHVTWPEFAGLERRRVDDELVIFSIKSRRSLKPGHVAAMTKLGLSVAANDLPVIDQG